VDGSREDRHGADLRALRADRAWAAVIGAIFDAAEVVDVQAIDNPAGSAAAPRRVILGSASR